MIRLQRFYAIPASDMSEGRLDDKIIGARMDGKLNFPFLKN